MSTGSPAYATVPAMAAVAPSPCQHSRLNLVERFFADLTEAPVRGGCFASVQKLKDSIVGNLAKRNHYTGTVQTGSSHGEPRSLLQRRVHSRD